MLFSELPNAGFPVELVLLGIAAFGAGMMDAVVGGGGLIQLPALFSALPSTTPATLLGTSKLAGVWGTGAAAISYARRVTVAWGLVLPAAAAAFVFAGVGAYSVSKLSPELFRKLLPFLLAVVAIYTFRKKEFGREHRPGTGGPKEKGLATLTGAGIGFYDGFFGPGTGSFLIFGFVRLFGFDFLRASVAAKLVNVSCNMAALAWFGYSGAVLLALGLMMAVCNVMGSVLGTGLAVKYGSGFIRRVFLAVLCLLIIKTGWDGFS